MNNEINYIINSLPDAETRSDVWALQTLHRIISGDCTDPIELEYFAGVTSYKAAFFSLLFSLKKEVNSTKPSRL